MKFAKTMMMAGVAALLSGSALAATAILIKNLPTSGEVTLNGTVESFDSQHSFTLRDSSGTIKVDLSATKAIVLKDGAKVSVTGTVDKGILETDIAALSVSEDEAVGKQIGEAIDSVTGQDPAGSAKAVDIRSLPESGIVKINGTVASVDNEKKFTLKDSTGTIDVTIMSGQSASLNKGTKVMVVGSVDKGLLGKSISATEVDVRSTAGPVVEQ